MNMDQESNSSSFLRHEPCEDCGSKDNKAVYTDHSYCFGCGNWKSSEGELVTVVKEIKGIIEGEYKAISKRGIKEDICQRFGYQIGQYHGKFCHIANYKNPKGEVVAQKLRLEGKKFAWVGDTEGIGFFGQHLCREGGRFLIVCEGELDCLSISQAFNGKASVVSLSHGAKSAAKTFKKHIEFLSTFDSVVICFDNDEAGREAAGECALLLEPGKAKIVTGLPNKDANECLMQGNIKELVSAIYDAKVFRPDGIVSGDELLERLLEDKEVESIPYPWQGLQDLTHGIRQGEMVTLCAGTGVGKSSICRELAYWLIKNNKNVGYIALEESIAITVRGMIGIHVNSAPYYHNYTDEELSEAFHDANYHKQLALYDHFGSIEFENLLSKIRYMHRQMGCSHVFLDHLSIVVSGIEGDNERKLIDICVTKLRMLVEELGIALFLVSQLKRPTGDRGYEDGMAVSINALRGSGSIAHVSNQIVSAERDQGDEQEGNTTTLRVLKNRYSGTLGVACKLDYDKTTGRLTEQGTAEWSNGDVHEVSSIPF